MLHMTSTQLVLYLAVCSFEPRLPISPTPHPPVPLPEEITILFSVYMSSSLLVSTFHI